MLHFGSFVRIMRFIQSLVRLLDLGCYEVNSTFFAKEALFVGLAVLCKGQKDVLNSLCANVLAEVFHSILNLGALLLELHVAFV